MADASVTVTIDLTRLREEFEAVGRELRPEGLLKVIGEAHLAWIAENFDTEGGKVGGWAPLSPNTIAAKGSSKILQDKGLLRQFTYEISGNTMTVGTRAPYASFHQEGVRPYSRPILPVYAKQLSFMTTDGWVHVKRVDNHPGIPQRRILPTEEESDQMSGSLIDAKLQQLINRSMAG